MTAFPLQSGRWSLSGKMLGLTSGSGTQDHVRLPAIVGPQPRKPLRSWPCQPLQWNPGPRAKDEPRSQSCGAMDLGLAVSVSSCCPVTHGYSTLCCSTGLVIELSQALDSQGLWPLWVHRQTPPRFCGQDM